ncbi:MAG TPA: DUF2116 family Zn-ribbon domain-containing protein [Candidatus Lokiarchaeia archaeon]|nr:DUF2116 family Zn-ribbon domain-containing protein [Candidatus Lokiarchaeia archaeon]
MTEAKNEIPMPKKGWFGRKNKAETQEQLKTRYEQIDQKTEEWRGKIPKNMVEHSHCGVCGRAIHLGKKYCSVECKGKLEGANKKQKKSQNLMCIVMAAVLPIMMILMFAFQH